MGEIADMMLDGTLDEYTGEYIGPAVGYPRLSQHRYPKGYRKNRQDNPEYGHSPLKGIQAWVICNTAIKRPGPVWKAIKRYCKDVLQMSVDIDSQDSKQLNHLAAIVSQHHWVAFMKWVKETYK